MADNDQNAAAIEAASAGNVDKIRDILFGGQMRDYERRFQELEDRLLEEGAQNRLVVGNHEGHRGGLDVGGIRDDFEEAQEPARSA